MPSHALHPTERQCSVRPVQAHDLSALLALNNTAVPHVNGHDRDSFAALTATAAHVLVAERDDEVAGFVVAFTPGAAYASANYRWFAARHDDFCYVDRIVTVPRHRRTGIGARLYREVARATDAPLITCEVNVRPPNDTSMAFHERLGFRPVGTQDTEGGAKTVRMLACDRTVLATD